MREVDGEMVDEVDVRTEEVVEDIVPCVVETHALVNDIELCQ